MDQETIYFSKSVLGTDFGSVYSLKQWDSK